jgi:NTP pyrophosphatase (non-canonical NTP hydrolase)
MLDESTTLAQLRGLVADFVAEREWGVYHDAKNLSMSIAIEAAELMEHFQWVRNEELAHVVDDPKVQSEIRDEVADILCFVLALANVLELDLAGAVDEKMTKNAAKYPVETFRGRYFKPQGGAGD